MALVERYVSVAGGGAHNGTTEADAFTFAEMMTDSATSAAGTRYNIKAGTYSRTTTVDTLGSGTATSPKIYRGYSSVIGDGYLGRTNDNGPLILTNMPVITYTTGRMAQGSANIMECLNISGATSISGTVTLGNNGLIRACKIVNTSTGSANDTAIVSSSINACIFDSDVFHTGGSGAGSATRGLSNGSRIIGCRMGSTTGQAILLNTTNAINLVAFNTLFSCGLDAIQITAAQVTTIIYNTIVGCTGDGIDSIAQSNLNFIYGNMITDNGAFGGTFGGAASLIGLAYNRTRDNVSGAYNNAADWVTATSWGEVTTDTGGETSDYFNPTSDDYRLVAQSPAANASIPAKASMGALQLTGGSSSSNGGRIPTYTI